MKKLPLVSLFFMSLALIVFSCVEDQPDYPEHGMIVSKILGEEKDCTCSPIINEYTWEGSTVYALESNDPLCQWVYSLYDENGDKASIEYSSDFYDQSTFIENIYRCNDGELAAAL